MREPASHLDRLGAGEEIDLMDLGDVVGESERARNGLEDTLERLIRECSAIMHSFDDAEAGEHSEPVRRGDLAHPGRAR